MRRVGSEVLSIHITGLGGVCVWTGDVSEADRIAISQTCGDSEGLGIPSFGLGDLGS